MQILQKHGWEYCVVFEGCVALPTRTLLRWRRFGFSGRRSCVVLLWRGNDVPVVVAGRVDDVVVKQAEDVSETAKAARRERCLPLPEEWLV